MKIYKERFKKIITFLETLDESKFDYDIVAHTVSSGHCGTKGCVLGYFPDIFEGEFTLEPITEFKVYPVHCKTPHIKLYKYLGITSDEFDILFEPGTLEAYIDTDQLFTEYSEFKHLDKDSAPYEVVKLLYKFYGNKFI